MAYDVIRNPVSHIERWGFSFGWIPIRDITTSAMGYLMARNL
jgi:hypothetical protein